MAVVRLYLAVITLFFLQGSRVGAYPLTLPDALKAALEKNPTLKSAIAHSRISSADRNLADAAANPRLGASLSYTHLNKPTLFGGQEVFKKTSQSQMLTLSMPLFNDSINLNRLAALRFEKADLLSAEAVKETVLLQVAQSYWSAASAREYVKSANDAYLFLESNLKRLKASREAGAATKGDLLRAEAELALASDRLLSAKNASETALAALKLAIGMDQSEDIEISEDALEPDESILKLEPGESPRLNAAEAAAQGAKTGVKAARAGNLPTVSLEADAMTVAQGAEFPRRDGSVSALIRLSFPIFDGGVTSANIKKAAAQADRAASELKAVQDQLEFERKTTLLALNSAYERWKATEKQVEAASESRRLVDIGVKEGIYTQTDLLSAQSAVTAARTSRIESLTALKIAEARRLAAISRLEILFGN